MHNVFLSTFICVLFWLSPALAEEMEDRIYVDANAIAYTEDGSFVLCINDKIMPVSILYADGNGYYVLVGRYASWTCRRCHTHNSYVEKCSNPTCGCPRLFCDPDVIHAKPSE